MTEQPQEHNDAHNRPQERNDWRQWITADRITIVVAAAAAGFTGWQTLLTRNAMQISNRAFVSINDVVISPKGVGDVFHWEPTIINNGNTTTKDLTVQFNYLNGRFDDNYYKCDFDIGPHPRISIGPHAMITLPTDPPLSSSLIKDWQNDIAIQTHVHVWGWAKYKDIILLDDHVTRFCWSIEAIRGYIADLSHDLSVSHTLCGKGNCTDDECSSDDKTVRDCTMFMIPAK